MNAPVSLPALRRRHWSALAAAALLGGAGLPLRAAGRTLPLSVSLPDELAQALAGRQPLVVMVSLHRCPWCEEVRNNYLAPMREREGLPVVQVDMRSEQGTRTVQGAGITHDALVRAWQVKVAPTVLFLGRDGAEVADRLIGGSPDFYHGYLERRLEQARQAVAAAP
ncbi:hypothetical protein GCM10027019_19770 [Melaminivora jejuensis]|uniref:hypothetical protein n=1 Tax=Melaminivora jejuensis TaxID=1267217 RepID=UPI001E53D27C|nr:hypothetical protein [Melaminivora jejuensis]UHJ64986.1 hypothetical protein LVC68_00145 [Melaminivora jejuensis]